MQNLNYLCKDLLPKEEKHHSPVPAVWAAHSDRLKSTVSKKDKARLSSQWKNLADPLTRWSANISSDKLG